MVNLLPHHTLRSLRHMYYARLTTLAATALSIAVLIGGVLLVPPWILAERAADAGERYAQALEETVGLKERTGVSQEVRALAERARAVTDYSAGLSSSTLFQALFEKMPSTVRVVSIRYRKGEEAFSVSVAGEAQTREALLAYVDALRRDGGFENVTVPVSQLALDANIPFSLTATYTP